MDLPDPAAGSARSSGAGDAAGGDDSSQRVLSWLDEDESPAPEEPPLRFGRPVLPAPHDSAPHDPPGGPYQSAPYTDRPGDRHPMRRRRRLVGAGLVVAVTVVAVTVLAAATTAVTYITGWRPDSGTAGRDASAPRIASTPLNGLARANLEVITGGSPVTVRGGGTGGDLYRIGTPEGGRAVPQVARADDRFTLRLVPSGRDGPDGVEIRLSDAVSWDLQLSGGAAVRVVEAAGLGLRGLAVAGGSTRTELDLPRPSGTVPIRLAGGLDELVVRLPGGVPARVLVGGGAGRVVIDGRIREGVAAGRVLGTLGWEKSPRRYEIEVSSGASTVTVQREDR